MKKSLSLVLSLMMILATLTALPFTAQANETIKKVSFNCYFDRGDLISFAPSTTGQHFDAYSIEWEDQNGQPFTNEQKIVANPNETYTLTAKFAADTGYEFWDNISVDFNGVRLQDGGANINENQYKLTTMNYELQLTVTFRYLEAELYSTPDFSYSHYIEAYSGFYIKDQEFELEPPEYDEKYHFDHWDTQGDFIVNYPKYSYSKAYMGVTSSTLLAYYTEHTWNDGVVTTAPTCSANGVKTYTCGCGAKKAEEIAATGNHTWDAGAVTKKATPTATGVKTYTCTVCSETKTETIAKCAKYKNTLTVKAKKPTIKFKNLKKKNQTIAAKSAMTVSKAQGKVTYKKTSGNKKITVSKAGKITVKKGLKKGTYKVKIKVTAAGNATYKAATKTVTVTIKVK